MMDNSNKFRCFRITQAYCSVCTWGFIQHFAVVRKLSFLLWITLLSCGLCVELGLETKVQGFGGMFLAKYECWAVAIRACRRNHTFSTQFHARTHTAPTVSKDRISPLTPIFLSFSNHSPSLSVFLSSILFVSPVSTIQDPPPLNSIPASTVTQIHIPAPKPPALSPGCHSNSVGGERHPCLTPLCNHTPILFLLPLQSHPVFLTHPIPTSPTPAGHLQLSANRNHPFLRHSRGCKAAQQQWREKREIVVKTMT